MLAQPVCGSTALAGFPIAFKESWHLVNGRGEKTRMKNNLKVMPILIRSRNRQSSLASQDPLVYIGFNGCFSDSLFPFSSLKTSRSLNPGKEKKKKRRESCRLLKFSVPSTGFMLQQPLNNATVSIGQQTDATPESWKKWRHLPLFNRQLLHSEKWILFTRVWEEQRNRMGCDCTSQELMRTHWMLTLRL